MVSYEISLGLSLVGVLILSGSFSLQEIVAAQSGSLPRHSEWNIFQRTNRRLLYLFDCGVCGNKPHSL